MKVHDSKERVRKWRERLKADPDKWKEHLSKEQERDKARRKKNILRSPNNKRQLKLKRLKDSARQRKHRQEMKEKKEVENITLLSPLGSYRCPQTLGKAVHRVKKSLPNSPTKRTAILNKIIQGFSVTITSAASF